MASARTTPNLRSPKIPQETELRLLFSDRISGVIFADVELEEDGAITVNGWNPYGEWITIIVVFG